MNHLPRLMRGDPHRPDLFAVRGLGTIDPGDAPAAPIGHQFERHMGSSQGVLAANAL